MLEEVHCCCFSLHLSNKEFKFWKIIVKLKFRNKFQTVKLTKWTVLVHKSIQGKFFQNKNHSTEAAREAKDRSCKAQIFLEHDIMILVIRTHQSLNTNIFSPIIFLLSICLLLPFADYDRSESKKEPDYLWTLWNKKSVTPALTLPKIGKLLYFVIKWQKQRGALRKCLNEKPENNDLLT